MGSPARTSSVDGDESVKGGVRRFVANGWWPSSNVCCRRPADTGAIERWIEERRDLSHGRATACGGAREERGVKHVARACETCSQRTRRENGSRKTQDASRETGRRVEEPLPPFATGAAWRARIPFGATS